MSKHHDEVILKRDPSQAIDVCRSAVEKIGWRLGVQSNLWLTAMQTPQGMSFGNPVTVDITLSNTGNGSTHLTLKGSNIGFGPIQSHHVKNQVLLLRQAIEQVAMLPEPVQAICNFTRQVTINDDQISDEALTRLQQQYGLRINDGHYWYDNASGAWGLKGQHTSGFVAPNLNLGLLREDASNGNTGVFINGRQLHTVDVQGLQKLVGQVWPGRWWVDALGNFGPEGSMALGNLWLLAQQRTPQRSGSSYSSSAGSLTVGGEDGFVYAQGRDALGNPIGAWSG